MERHARLVELVNRLGGDLWPRLITAAGVAVVLWLYMDARLALIWLILIGVNESFELWSAQGIRKGGSMAGRFEAAFLANLSFGSIVWAAMAWLFWTSGGVGGIVIGLAVVLGSLYHVSCNCVSYARSLIAAGTPFLAVFAAMPFQMFQDQRHASSTAIEVTLGFVFLSAYMLTALLASVERDNRLRAALNEAETATHAKSHFLAVMSHEIRTPMNGVIGMLDLLSRHDLEFSQRKRVQTALQSARDLVVILDDVLTFSKLEAGESKFERLPVSVPYLVSTTVQLFTPTAEKKGLKLEWSSTPTTPHWIESDPSRLRQVLSNLISNAIKFTDNGTIKVCVDHKGDAADGRLSIFVMDTGIGVTEEQRLRLFKPFSQADTATGRLYGGTGLGLAICKQLIEAMGGQIGVVSELGVGSQFWFILPAPPTTAPRSSATSVRALPEPAATQRSLRVLTVDDHPVSQQLLKMLLEISGHYVQQVSDGDSAIKRLKEEPFDLVLMDVQMPGIDGPTATRLVRTTEGPNRTVPIVAVTANTDQIEHERYRASGMTDCIAKPIEAEILFETIHRLVGTGNSARV
ncbi:MAG: response regulator [Hyphomonadaceae bacterium]|nr:response regulator [Hyphomonadaceae bacterium]